MRPLRLILCSRRRVAVLVLAASAIAVTAVGGPAQAKYPGTNGRIAFTSYDPSTGDSHVFVANPDGTKVQQLPPDAADMPFGHRTRMLITICCVTGPPRPAIINADGSGFTLLNVPDLPPDGAVACNVVIGRHPTPLPVHGEYRPLARWDLHHPSLGRRGAQAAHGQPFPPTGNFGGGDIPGDYSPDR
jgi:hypothetical protein